MLSLTGAEYRLGLHLSRAEYWCYTFRHARYPAPAVQDPSFGFIAGDPALDFVNTVDWTDAGQVDERLTDYDALARWSVEAGVLPRSAGDRLRRSAAARPREARATLAEAIRTREILHEVFTAVADRQAAGQGAPRPQRAGRRGDGSPRVE